MRIRFIFILFAFFLLRVRKRLRKPIVRCKAIYPQGKIVSVDKAAKMATIDHEDIPGVMDAMTMAFPIREDSVWEELKPGSTFGRTLLLTMPKANSGWRIFLFGGAECQPARTTDQ